MDYGYDDEEAPYKDPYLYDLEKEFPFLKDDPEMGGRAPADVQRSMDDEMPAMAMDDEDEMEMEGACPKCGMSPCACPMHEEEAVTEDASDETFDMVDMIADALGHKNALEAVVQAMSQDDARSTLSYIIQQYDLGTYDDKIVKEKSTDDHDDNPALKGGQDSLPDELQKAIIGDEEEANEEKLSAFQRDLRRRQAMKDAYDERMRKEKEGQDANEAATLDTSTEDRYGDMKHVIKGIRFSDNGDIEADVRAMEQNEELADWLYGELGSDDVIADEFGNEYTGADVQDYLNTDDVELPDIAETQEDFYAQMRTDARTLSEDWNKSIRNKRSSLLNERLMKAWNFKK